MNACVLHGLIHSFCQVGKLRKSLLQFLQIREFSEAAQFKDPCRSIVLPDVICNFCNKRQDMDLCRNANLLKKNEETEEEEVGGDKEWARCEDCSHPYNKDMVEHTLVEIVQRYSLKFQVQDVQCSKTKQAVTDCMPLYSKNAGSLSSEHSPEQAHEYLTTLLNIATYHNFEWLKETVQVFLQQETDFDASEAAARGNSMAASMAEE
jgi:DNA polymerase epsilon subunit 1